MSKRNKGMNYGDKRDYGKIEIYVNMEYKGTTTWARTLVEAAARYASMHPLKDTDDIHVSRQKG